MKNRADHLAKFIANNWHWCPIDGDCEIHECEGWRYDIDYCSKCLVKNVEKINIKEDK